MASAMIQEPVQAAVMEPLSAASGGIEAVATAVKSGGGGGRKNRIQVSSSKKPLFFYVNLAKRYMQQYNEIELSALGMAIGTVVTVAEILKNNGLATEKKILTSTVGSKDEAKGRMVQKAKIEILLEKSENFDDLISATKTGGQNEADYDEKEKKKDGNGVKSSSSSPLSEEEDKKETAAAA